MKGLCLVVFFAFMAVKSSALADTESAPFPKIITTRDGGFFFKMVPAKWVKKGGRHVIGREAFGVAYELSKEGDFKEIWKTKGWYAFDGHLSRDGRYFVRMGPWASDQENHTDLAIVFYDSGKLLKKYQVKDLVKNPELLEDSVSHYFWRPQTQTKPNGFKNYKNETFHLVMIDKTFYDFDVTKGEILETGVDAGARSYTEIRIKEEKEINEKGLALYGSSSFKKDYDKHFLLTGIRADRFVSSGVSFRGPRWTANLEPKKKYSQPCKVYVVFSVSPDGKIEEFITAAEIDAALEKALLHPFVAKRFESGGATGLRLRMSGGRLPWNTPGVAHLF